MTKDELNKYKELQEKFEHDVNRIVRIRFCQGLKNTDMTTFTHMIKYG